MEEITQANIGFFWNQVFTLSKENKNQEAIAILDKLLKLRPNESCLHCQKGVCLYNVKSYDEALVSYNKAIELGGPDALIYNNIGYIYSDTEDYETSFKYYKLALDTDPKYPPAHKEMGRLYLKDKKFEDALASLDNAIKFAKENGIQDPSFHCYKAMCYRDMGKPDLALQEAKIASNLLENGIIGRMSSGLITKTKETIKEILLFENGEGSVRED